MRALGILKRMTAVSFPVRQCKEAKTTVLYRWRPILEIQLFIRSDSLSQNTRPERAEEW